jgi:hypothetical protein
VRRIESRGKGKKTKKVPGRFVVSREQVFSAINEWHHGNGHACMERMSTYCREQYFNWRGCLLTAENNTLTALKGLLGFIV